MFGPEEDDTDFLSPTGGAKLASLFGLDQEVSGQENESFQYVAPKQPKKGGAAEPKPQPQRRQQQAAPGPPAVLSATAVHAHRFCNGQYVKQGKFGAAVLGNHESKEYKILLYTSQQKPVASALIHPGFLFLAQASHYSTFYDDHRQNWSIMFESEQSAADFSKQVCLAKCNGSPSLDSVLCQDLVLGEGEGAEVGDSMEVAYTGWLFENREIGEMFDSNLGKDKLLRLKLGSGKVIKGWGDGMVGMKKGGKRLLIIPPVFAYGSAGVPGRIPPDSTLVFEVEVKRIKFVKDSGPEKQSTGAWDSAVSSPITVVDTPPTELAIQHPDPLPAKTGEPAIRLKSNSISKQLANPDVTKAKLISRMARMGQPMLPFLATVSPTDLDTNHSEMEDQNTPSDSSQLAHGMSPQMFTQDVTDVQSSCATSRDVIFQNSSGMKISQPPVSGLQLSSATPLQVSALQSPPTIKGNVPAFQPYSGKYIYEPVAVGTSQLQTVGQMYMQPLPQFQASGDITSFLVTEARQHNTEIRVAVSKVADKVDHLMCKMDDLQKQNAGSSMLLPNISSVAVETAVIMNNIQRIIQENEKLKNEVLEKNKRIEQQNEMISEHIQRYQRYVEQSHQILEKRHDSLLASTENTEARVLHAEQAKAKIAEDLAAATQNIFRLQLELTSNQTKEMKLREQLTGALQEVEDRGKELSLLQVKLTELQETSDHALSQCKADVQSRRQQNIKVTSLEDELLELRMEKENLKKDLAERRKKSQLEHRQVEENMVEIHKSYQDKLERMRQLLKKAQTSTEQVTADQVKKIMNRVFQSLRGEFDLEEHYTGKDVLGIIMDTIKTVTLQLLHPPKSPTETSSCNEDEEEMAEQQNEGGTRGIPLHGKEKGVDHDNMLPESLRQKTKEKETIEEMGFPATLHEEEPIGTPSTNPLHHKVPTEQGYQQFEASLGVHEQPESLLTTQMLPNDVSNSNISTPVMYDGLRIPLVQNELNPEHSGPTESQSVRQVETLLKKPTPQIETPSDGTQPKIKPTQSLTRDLIQEKDQENSTSHQGCVVQKPLEAGNNVEVPSTKGSREEALCSGVQSGNNLKQCLPSSDITPTGAVEKIKDEVNLQQQMKNFGPKKNTSSVPEEDDDGNDDLFKATMQEPRKPTQISELEAEEGEEESLKGQPPPALFLDDGTDEDLDWIS